MASGPEASHAGRCQLIENQAQATFAPPLTRPLVFVNLMRDFGSRVVSDDVGTDQKFLVETVAVDVCFQSGQEPQFCAGDPVMHTIRRQTSAR